MRARAIGSAAGDITVIRRVALAKIALFGAIEHAVTTIGVETEATAKTRLVQARHFPCYRRFLMPNPLASPLSWDLVVRDDAEVTMLRYVARCSLACQ